MQITKNFSLQELTDSNTAKKYGYNEQFNPSQDIIDNLTDLAVHILQPLRDLYGKPITVNCAYRCKRTNDKVGGVDTSQHLIGEAADITCDDNTTLFELAKTLPFDQLIWEQKGVWIHISYNEQRHRRQILYL